MRILKNLGKLGWRRESEGVVVSILEIVEKKIEKNKGHNVKAHGFRSVQQTGLKTRGCYRCRLLNRLKQLEKRG